MSKLVDKERLAQLAAALDGRMKAAVAAEAEARVAADEALQAAIDAINHGESGILALAKAYADAQDTADKNAQALVDADFEGRIAAIEAKFGEGEGTVEEMIEAVQSALDKFIEDQAKKDGEQDEAIQAAQDAIDVLNGTAEEAGSVAKAVAVAVKAEEDRAKEVEEDHEARIAANEAFVAAQPAIDQAQNDRIKALEDANKEGGAVANAIKAAQEAADAAQADVDAVEERLDAEGGLVDRIEANEANIARLDGAVDVEGSVKKQIKDAIDAVNGAADALEDRVEVLEGEMDAIEAVVGKAAVEADENGEGAQAATGLHKLIADEDARVLSEAKAHAEQKITDLIDSAPEAMNTLKELADAIKDNKDVYDGYVAEHAQAMATMKSDLQKEIDDDVKVVADELANQKNAELEGSLANQIKVEKGRAEGQEAAIREELADAIAQEVEDRNDAIATALEAYSTTEEMKAVLGNVVNSLALTMENDKVVLKLGGVDGIELTSVDLDLATDDDIKAIIAGLDTPAAE